MIKINFSIINYPLNDRERGLLLTPLSKLEISTLPRNVSQSYDASLAGKVQMKYDVINQLEVSTDEVVIDKNNLGKPYLFTPMGKHVDVSISHTGSYLVTAIATGSKVGVDIECLREFDIAAVENFFSKIELNNIYSQKTKRKQLKAFFKLWTIKEAYLKMIGQGLSAGIPEIQRISEKGEVFMNLQSKPHFSTLIQKDFVLSICTDEPISGTFLERYNIIPKPFIWPQARTSRRTRTFNREGNG